MYRVQIKKYMFKVNYSFFSSNLNTLRPWMRGAQKKPFPSEPLELLLYLNQEVQLEGCFTKKRYMPNGTYIEDSYDAKTTENQTPRSHFV